MKKNFYKYAAMALIVETLSEKVDSLRNSNKYSIERYKDDVDGIPEWVQTEIDKNTGMADYLEEFISKL